MAEEKNFSEVLHRFAGQAFEVREKLVANIEEAGPAISIDALAERVSAKASAEKDFVAGLLNGIAPIIPIVALAEDSRKEIASVFSQIATNAASKNDADQKLAGQIGRLLACESSIGLTAKAQNIIWGHGNVYRDAQTISQIRPLFRAELKAGTEYAVFVHELRIEFQVDGNEKSFCVVMDTDKIKQLREVLDRALSKEQVLRDGRAFNYLATRS